MRSLLSKSTTFIVGINPLKPRPINFRGFTLVELLVVIVILSILGVVGVTLFSSTQARARDAKRKADIQAMSKAMEANYSPGVGYPTALVGTWFADGAAPTNPAPPAGGVYTTTFTSTAAFTFCAPLENNTGNATSNIGAGMTGITNGPFFCKKNSQ
jgi:prepilin-type N-terminal cleavage/methylation domain-containing protein